MSDAMCECVVIEEAEHLFYDKLLKVAFLLAVASHEHLLSLQLCDGPSKKLHFGKDFLD